MMLYYSIAISLGYRAGQWPLISVDYADEADEDDEVDAVL